MIDTAHPRCAVCRRPLRGPEDGVAFGAAGRLLFLACNEHAPLVRAGAKTAVTTVLAGVNTFIDRKLPILGQILREVRALRNKELEV